MKAWILVLGLLGCGGPASEGGAGPGGYRGTHADPIVVASGAIRHFPFAFDASGQTLVSYSQHPDAYVQDPVDAMAGLVGAGTVSGMVQAANFYISGIAIVGGALYAVSYITAAVDSATERAYGWRSLDDGRTWQPQLGVVHLTQAPRPRPAEWGCLLLHRRIHLLDGFIVGTAYGNYDSDGDWYRTVWAASADEGKNWSIVATVAQGAAGTEGYGEPVSAFCPDGRILVVMRTGPTSPMRLTRSGDRGLTWEPPREIPGRVGWDPDLIAAGPGHLLSYGLPGRVWVASSPDCGSSWRDVLELEIPGTSGYTGLAHLAGQVVLFTDSNSETTIAGYPIPASALGR